MNQFVMPVQLQWSDLDPNRHLRHSAYYDFGATLRIACFSELGLTPEKMLEDQIGPILLREEAVFKREVRFGDKLTIDLAVTRSNSTFSRWSIRHHLIKDTGEVAAILTMDGAWIDLAKRKMAVPPQWMQEVFAQLPRDPTFVWI